MIYRTVVANDSVSSGAVLAGAPVFKKKMVYMNPLWIRCPSWRYSHLGLILGLYIVLLTARKS